MKKLCVHYSNYDYEFYDEDGNPITVEEVFNRSYWEETEDINA